MEPGVRVIQSSAWDLLMDAGLRVIHFPVWELLIMDAGVREVQSPSWELIVEPGVRESHISLRLQTLVRVPKPQCLDSTSADRGAALHYMGSVDSGF